MILKPVTDRSATFLLFSLSPSTCLFLPPHSPSLFLSSPVPHLPALFSLSSASKFPVETHFHISKHRLLCIRVWFCVSHMQNPVDRNVMYITGILWSKVCCFQNRQPPYISSGACQLRLLGVAEHMCLSRYLWLYEHFFLRLFWCSFMFMYVFM